jgi:hypothetical protein
MTSPADLISRMEAKAVEADAKRVRLAAQQFGATVLHGFGEDFHSVPFEGKTLQEALSNLVNAAIAARSQAARENAKQLLAEQIEIAVKRLE